MDYEKLHKDTITKLQEMVNSGKITVEIARGICEDFIPESDDERIRKALIHFISEQDGFLTAINGISVKDITAWLESKGEQKPVWSEEDEEMMNYTIGSIDTNISDSNFKNIKLWLKSLKDRVQPKQEWSEEDEMELDAAIHLVSSTGHIETTNWLKSLKDRYTWKPSDEQMEILQYLCETSSHPNEKVIPILESLYEDLKKLREE